MRVAGNRTGTGSPRAVREAGPWYAEGMALPEAVKKVKNVFVEIFSRHWEEFKRKHPSYDRAQYEEPVQKMLGCGREEGGYSEYRCTNCGRGLRRVAPVVCEGVCGWCRAPGEPHAA
jgi:hypothetical protein